MKRVAGINRWNKEHVKNTADLDAVFQSVVEDFKAQPWSDLASRKARLKTFKEALLANQDDLIETFSNDYGHRSRFDSVLCDLMPSVNHIRYTLKHLRRWMKPSSRAAGILLSPSRVKVHYQPLGVVGVIVPWNFPIFLSIAPVATAIAAGNRVMVKLSELTPHTNEVLSRVGCLLRWKVTLILSRGMWRPRHISVGYHSIICCSLVRPRLAGW